MKITKYGHCSLLIEEGNLRILTDPGNLSPAQAMAREVDLILITHEHQDHFHLDSLREVLANNPKAKIITNTAIAKLLRDATLDGELLEDGGKKIFQGVQLEGFGTMHAEIYPTWPRVQNTGYMIAERLFYPGDAFYNPARPVEVLALPVAGPWLKISEAIDYAKEVKPRIAFPVHDGGRVVGVTHLAPSKILPTMGIEFLVPEESKMFEV